ncbi:hypothetical protein BO82DRAFT_162444 [Aspergillus uvarum CBS 121591]|uniref:Uncharacterized protein n=1 Tax=Aspergillus uvarum CBS 121591 TaxID=1448315 RepID=A0A319CRE1_9EURO|nr:hypothetical protein BO82DRAFT_162444 [Aspergillus uvarum CBS 121591]PYH85517.1 hypothetical protein BO82DRAFT_162444 [Aspergillus uvarum CBS 121591]
MHRSSVDSSRSGTRLMPSTSDLRPIGHAYLASTLAFPMLALDRRETAIPRTAYITPSMRIRQLILIRQHSHLHRLLRPPPRQGVYLRRESRLGDRGHNKSRKTTLMEAQVGGESGSVGRVCSVGDKAHGMIVRCGRGLLPYRKHLSSSRP